MTATEIVTPLPVTASGTAMGALTGLTGYMTLGLGAKAKPAVVQVGESEMLIAKDGELWFTSTIGLSPISFQDLGSSSVPMANPRDLRRSSGPRFLRRYVSAASVGELLADSLLFSFCEPIYLLSIPSRNYAFTNPSC